MTDNYLSDETIITLAKGCLKCIDKNPAGCPFKTAHCKRSVLGRPLEIIERQKAEISELKKEIRRLKAITGKV